MSIIAIQDQSRSVSLPSDPVARLMYYLNSVIQFLTTFKGIQIPNEFTDFRKHSSLDDDTLLALCIIVIEYDPKYMIIIITSSQQTKFQEVITINL
jgi:hypothetical protein